MIKDVKNFMKLIKLTKKYLMHGTSGQDNLGYFGDKSMRMFEDPFKFIQTEIQTHNSR